MAKKKKHFIQLTIVFVFITMLSLFSRWSNVSPDGMQATMMDSSMGGMMSMHLREATIADLLVQEEQKEASTGQSSHDSHHGEGLQKLHYLITATIIILLPLIAAGTVFLAAAWFR